MELRVLSLNIFARPVGVNSNDGNDLKGERLRHLFEQLHGYDVVCLQELFSVGSMRHINFIHDAYEIGFRYFVTSTPPAMLSWKMIDGGCVILSRYPIRKKDYLVFKDGAGIDGLTTKGVLHAHVEVPTEHKVPTRIHVFTTHTQAGGDAIRESQVNEMSEFVSNVVNSSTDPILITGDFNTDALHRQHAYKHLVDKLKCVRSTQVDAPNASTPLHSSVDGAARRGDSKSDCDASFQDLLHLTYGFHPVTNGHGHAVIKTEKKFSIDCPTGEKPNRSRKSIDYMFFLPSTHEDAVRIQHDPEKTLVTDFAASNKPFTQISDHYACVTTLRIESPVSETWDPVGDTGDLYLIHELKGFHLWRFKPCLVIATPIVLVLFLIFALSYGLTYPFT